MTTTGNPSVVLEYGSTLEVVPFPVDESSLLGALTDLFEQWWESIGFATLVQGAAWEIRAPGPPERIGMYDGYVTVDFGDWHFHICIGEHTESGPELGRIRRVARAELYRGLGPDAAPTTWGFRMFNGEDTQLITVLLPNPFLSDGQRPLAEPDFSRLAAWDHLRRRYLGLDADPRDRVGTRFSHG